MSDGPFKSLDMNIVWKRTAKYADSLAYSKEELADQYANALHRTFIDEVPQRFLNLLSKEIFASQSSLFPEHIGEKITRIRESEALSVMCQTILNLAEKEFFLRPITPDTLTKVLTEALLDRACRSNRQIEEHFYRVSNDSRATNVRERLEQSYTKVTVKILAQRCLSPIENGTVKKIRQQVDLDAGVSIP